MTNSEPINAHFMMDVNANGYTHLVFRYYDSSHAKYISFCAVPGTLTFEMYAVNNPWSNRKFTLSDVHEYPKMLAISLTNPDLGRQPYIVSLIRRLNVWLRSECPRLPR